MSDRSDAEAHPQPVDLAKAYRLLNHGPTVLVSARHAGVTNVMAAAWACVLDLNPTKVTVVLDKIARTRELAEASGRFVLQVPVMDQLTMVDHLGTTTLHDDPQKLAKSGVNLFEIPGYTGPFVSGCAAWLSCRIIPEPANQSRYDLFIAEVDGAWADDRIFNNGHWLFEDASPGWRTIHHVSGGHYLAIGETISTNRDLIHGELKAQTSEIIALYNPPGVFFDILQPPDCVCTNCLDRMLRGGLDPLLPADRLKNDYAVLEEVRLELSAHVDAAKPGTRVFYNSGHIAKHGKDAYRSYSHLELESLPTGGWGYDHFPASARYADYLGFDFLGQTGKFHTSWGDFGGFKHPDALVYETAQMSALGAKCLVGDQLHPSGRMNRATYATIAPAYDRIRRLGPLLDGAQYQSEIAILASEYFHRELDGKNHAVDDGAVRMLLEGHRGFDIIDPDAAFGEYRLIILPDNIPVDAELGQRLTAFVKDGGKILLSGTSGIDPLTGTFSVDGGITYLGKNTFETSYVAAAGLKKLPDAPFAVYCPSERVSVQTAEVLGELRDPYFDRTYAHFCSHQHAPDNPDADSPGPAAMVSGGVGYIALPIFGAYHDAGQPYYRYLVDAVINRLLPDPLVVTDLPSAARVSLAKSGEDYVLHLMHGTPQVRGRSVKLPARHHRQAIEIIEDIPVLGPSRTSVRLEGQWSAYDALSGEQFAAKSRDGRLEVDVPSLHIHRAIVLTRATVSESILPFERHNDEQGR